MAGDRPAGALDSVSVILIVRNGARYIADALQSTRGSRRQPDEILVVDGGSTDDTHVIASGDSRVTVVEQQGRGIPAAYNEGIARSRGAFIAFISHDDVWLPGKLDRQLDYMLAHPSCQFTTTEVQHVLEPGAAAPPGFRKELLDGPVPGFIMECLVARRGVFDLVGPFDTSFAVGEDTDWFARARDLRVESVMLPGVYTQKRVHGTNASLTTHGSSALLLRALRASVERKRAGAAVSDGVADG